MEKQKVREARLEDFSFIYSSLKEDYREMGLLHRFKYSKEEFRDKIFGLNPLARFLVLEVNANPAGIASYSIDHRNFTVNVLPTVYLIDLYIKKNYRGKGGGKLLFNTLRDIATKEKCGQIEWLVQVENKQAIHFYEKYIKAKNMNSELCYMRLNLN